MKTIDGKTLKNMMKYGSYILGASKDELNALNIFPVPDGDTGTNMSLTMKASIKELEKLSYIDCCGVASAVASGSLRGARGNSGVILSQLFRGFSKGISGKSVLTTKDFAEALIKSSETAYKAVMKPKEGTVLTVARETGAYAASIAEGKEDFEEFLKLIIENAEAILNRTTNMLPALKAAGVVDAGGKGLVNIYKGFSEGLTKQAPEEASAERKTAGTAVSKTAAEEIKFGYCTEFIIEGKKIAENTMRGFTDYLQTIGDSVVAVYDEQIIKIHIHTNNPGEVIERAIKLGSLSNIKIDNMRIQHTELVLPSTGAAAPAAQPVPAFEQAAPPAVKTNESIGIIAVSVGEGINNIFKDLGCDSIIEGGQTMNPSAEDIYRAAEEINKDSFIILPNNNNIILAAKQAAIMLEKEKGVEARVLETKSIPQGIGAMLAMVYNEPFKETADAMDTAAKYIKTGLVTVAVRDTDIDGQSIKKGDYIGIIDGRIEAVARTSLAAGKLTIGKMVRDSEFITIYYSTRQLEQEGGELSDYVKYLDLECELHYGGQPVYTYIISAE